MTIAQRHPSERPQTEHQRSELQKALAMVTPLLLRHSREAANPVQFSSASGSQ
jgi:hypothetical protein